MLGMRRREFITLLGGAAGWPFAARAQQSARTYRIGYLGPGTASVLPAAFNAFRQQLRQLGYVEGQNLTIDYRWAGERDDQLARLASDLVRLKVDAIVVEGHTPAIQAAKDATTTVPIIMAVSGDPVGTGLVASLARPGGNVTGLTILSPDLAGKRLELLKEIVPKLTRVAVVWNAANPVKLLDWRETQAAAELLGLRLQSLEVRSPPDFERAFDIGIRDRAAALVVFSDGLINAHRKQILEFATSARLPAMYPYREFVVEGGLMSYAPSFVELFRRAATYVDKILGGAKPADLPVQQPTAFELVINLKAANALGLDMPATLLARAHEVIE
jgi:putative tryptophan/tyrosine transport system substrate-binding protein